MNGLYKRKVVPLTNIVSVLLRERERQRQGLGHSEMKLETQLFFILRANVDPGDWQAKISILTKLLSPWYKGLHGRVMGCVECWTRD